MRLLLSSQYRDGFRKRRSAYIERDRIILLRKPDGRHVEEFECLPLCSVSDEIQRVAGKDYTEVRAMLSFHVQVMEWEVREVKFDVGKAGAGLGKMGVGELKAVVDMEASIC